MFVTCVILIIFKDNIPKEIKLNFQIILVYLTFPKSDSVLRCNLFLLLRAVPVTRTTLTKCKLPCSSSSLHYGPISLRPCDQVISLQQGVSYRKRLIQIKIYGNTRRIICFPSLCSVALPCSGREDEQERMPGLLSL